MPIRLNVLGLRDRPFNLKEGGGGGLWFFVSFRMFFSDNTRVRIFFLSRKAQFFSPRNKLTLGYMTTKLWIRLFFFSSTKIRIFFSATLGIRIFFSYLLITSWFSAWQRSKNINKYEEILTSSFLVCDLSVSIIVKKRKKIGILLQG